MLPVALAMSSLSATAAPADEYRVPGLTEPVELRLDTWGVPHLYARNTDDVFLAQGFNAARDRLFQIDLWHRRGLGRLAEALGPGYVAQDRAARMFLYRGDMRREWNSYGPRAKRIATQFTRGINAYIGWLEKHPEAMPEEFERLRYRPGRWKPEDVVRIRSHGLTRNVVSEVQRSAVACTEGLEADRARKILEPEWRTRIPEGFDPCTLPPDVLDTFALATQQVSFSAEQGEIVSKARPLSYSDTQSQGSNAWTVSGSRTATGRPILANDPHRRQTAPALRYLAHLSAPGMEVIGGGEPALPGISIGHNGTIGFGLTMFAVDQEDLYVYELDPNDHSRYSYRDGWESIRTITERVPVAGEPARTVSLPFTRHGPVLKVDKQRNRAYALRTGWLRPGMAPYFGSVEYLRAKNFGEFTKAIHNWGAPSENQVYADKEGNTGWVTGGLTPRRTGYDGLMPVPGDGRYDWDGFYDGDDLPRSYNPSKGFFASANEMNLPPGFPYRKKRIGFEWSSPYRHQRITEMLSRNSRLSVDDSIALQNDRKSIPAQRILRVLAHLSTKDDTAAAALRLLDGWNSVESAGSAEAALFEVWRARHLEPAFLRAVVPKATDYIEQPDTAALLEAIEHPERWFGADAEANRDALLVDTLAAAYADTTELLGPDPSRWRWGDLQHSLFEHPMSDVLDDPAKKRFNVGPLPHGGSEHTVNASAYWPDTFQHAAGPSLRMVLDVGNWDASKAVNTPGQSGNPSSPHYRDLAKPWSEGEQFPLSYTRDAVEKHTERVIKLLPGS